MKSRAYLSPRARAARTVAAAVLAGVGFCTCAPAAVAGQPRIVVSIGSPATIGGIAVENEDLLMCDPISLGEGTTQCEWSLFFDGSAAGLNSKIVAADILPDGSLVLRVNKDFSIPDLSQVKSRDLALFIPADPLTRPYVAGEWRLFLDGDAVKDSSDGRQWDAVEVLVSNETCQDPSVPTTCDVLLSLPAGATLGGIAFANEDILRCRPTGHSLGGSITACDYSLFLDGGSINAGGFGSFTERLFALEVISLVPGPPFSGVMLFRASKQPSLPAHQGRRDLLRYVGSFDTLLPTGTVDLLFDGDAMAGLDGQIIQAVAVVPDGDGDGVPDGIDNCPNDANPDQADDDGDGAGNVCDQCPARTDPGCRCGDGVVDVPHETCDLGDDLNGQPGSACSRDCALVGRCTQSGVECQTSSDCPTSGEGCCGNGLREGEEECDDGNGIPDDGCSGSCRTTLGGAAVLGCEDLFGPNVVPAAGKPSIFTDTPKGTGPGFDRWILKGRFLVPPGVLFDPDTQAARIVFSQGTVLFEGNLPPGSFEENAWGSRVRWRFRGREGSTAGAGGWARAIFDARTRPGFGRLSHVRYKLYGKNAPVPIDLGALGGTLRQTIRVGDLCATTLLTCEKRSHRERLRCLSVQTSSPAGSFLEISAALLD